MTAELRDYNPSVTLVGTCHVCNLPVREEDDPTPIYADSDADIPAGYIHGAFDCTDNEPCAIIRRSVAAGGMEAVQACQLPEAHLGDCLWGEPS